MMSSTTETADGNGPSTRSTGSREMATLLKDESTNGFVDMLVPTSPLVTTHAPRRFAGDDDLLEGESRKISDHFEMEDTAHGDGGYGSDDSDDSTRGSGAHGMAHGTATRGQVAVNIFISFVGAGLLGLPYAFSRSGWLLGTLSLLLVSAGNVYAMLLLVKCRKKLERDGYIGIKGYGDLGREVMGPRGEVLVNVCLVVSQAGFATAYLIFIAANVQSITSGKAGRALIIYACVPILAMLVQFRDMKKLSPFSLVADVANLMGLSCVIFQDFEYYTHSDSIKAVDFTGVVYVISVCIYSLEGVGLILPLESSCANREGFPKLLKQVILGITLLMAFFGTCGYIAFGDDTISPISLNLQGESAAFVQMALCLAIYLTYPIMMFPVSDVLENLFLSDARKPPRSYCPSRTFRLTIVLMTATIAYTIPNFGKFLELVGASICTLLGFILPCMFHIKVFGRSGMKIWEYFLDVCIMIFGVFFGALGTVEAVMKLMEDDEVVTEMSKEMLEL
mmetsp:Transcript_19856/g.41643  ORF Transcript_19856/g.41643 Transcript_19856/m.41643 type:complete len:507 (+) Transcript_19856:198-1718(+)